MGVGSVVIVRRSSWIAAVTAVVLSATVWAAARTGMPQAPVAGLVLGRVIDEAGQPVAGVVVTLSGAPASMEGTAPRQAASMRRALTDANGRFLLRDLAPGTYSLQATLDGYAPGAYDRRRPGGPSRTLTIKPADRHLDVTLRIWQMATLCGTVVDDVGDPAVGVYVTALRRWVSRGRVQLGLGPGEATDDRGWYRISGIETGQYAVTIRFSTQTVAVSWADAYQAALDSGNVAAISREIADSGVILTTGPGILMGEWQVHAVGAPPPVPGPGGQLLISPTTYFPGVTSPSEATLITLAPGEDRTGVNFVLPLVASARVSGIVTGPAGPIPNQGLRLTRVDEGPIGFGASATVASGTTDAQGRFALIGVPPGRFELEAHRVPGRAPVFIPPPPGAAAAIRDVQVLAPDPAARDTLYGQLPLLVGRDDVANVEVVMRPGARVTGRIVFDGAAPRPTAARLQQMAFSIRPMNPDQVVPGADTRLDAEGRFETPGQAPGRYLVNVASPGPDWTVASIISGGVNLAAQPLTIADEDIRDVVVTFTDRVTELTGTVRPAVAGGETDASVIVFPVDFQKWLAMGMVPGRTATTRPDGAGAFSMRLGLPGEYFVVALPPDIAPDIDAASLAAWSRQASRVTVVPGARANVALTVVRR